VTPHVLQTAEVEWRTEARIVGSNLQPRPGRRLCYSVGAGSLAWKLPGQTVCGSCQTVRNGGSASQWLLLSMATQVSPKEEMDVNQALLAEIVARILTVARPDRIILFGSAATDEMTKDSDIDLLIVEPTPGNRHEEALRVRDAIGNIDYPVDVLIMATERFEATRNVIGGIAYPANKYGRVLYAAA